MDTDEAEIAPEATLVSQETPDIEEIIYLTDGLRAVLRNNGMVQIFPVWDDPEGGWSTSFAANEFQKFISDRKIEIIGIKQVTTVGEVQHWRWAPAVGCERAPDNNPSYRWNQVSRSLERALSSGDPLQSLSRASAPNLDRSEINRLITSSKHVAICLHQMNLSIVQIAEHLQHELVSLTHYGQRRNGLRYSHIRNLDLASYVHGLFQAYSAARDHFSRFLAIQIARPRVSGDEVDTMAKLLNSIEPDELKVLPIIQLLQKKGLLEAGKGTRKHKGKDRLVLSQDTWLHYANSLRNRFTHGAPYGTLDPEGQLEVYSPHSDKSLFLVRAFLEKDDSDFDPNLLRTVNHCYQSVCSLFLNAANMTGYIKDPVILRVAD